MSDSDNFGSDLESDSYSPLYGLRWTSELDFIIFNLLFVSSFSAIAFEDGAHLAAYADQCGQRWSFALQVQEQSNEDKAPYKRARLYLT